MSNPGPTALTAFVGPMFSGKTERLITQLKTYEYAKYRIKVGKPAVDTRTEDFIASRRIRNGMPEIVEKISATPIGSVEEFRAFTEGDQYDVLAFDEVQFFPLDAPLQDSLGWFGREVRALLDRRKDSSLQVVIAGLDTYSDDMPFGVMPGLLALSDQVEKLSAVCMSCHAVGARKSQNLRSEGAGFLVGDAGEYEARCRACFFPK